MPQFPRESGKAETIIIDPNNHYLPNADPSNGHLSTTMARLTTALWIITMATPGSTPSRVKEQTR